MAPIVALYARVSTQRQAKEATIDSQIAEIQAYAHQHQYDIAPEHEYLDPGVSGARLPRPGLDRLRDAAAIGAVTHLLCLAPDRLARKPGVQQVLLDEFRRARVQVIFVKQADLPDTPEQQLLLNMQVAFSEYERAILSERMRRGKRHRLSTGESLPSHAPYGYRYQPRTKTIAAAWVIEPAEAAIVQQVFAWYAEHEQTLGQIAERLSAQDTPSPGGCRWRSETVRRLLRHSAYRGVAYWQRYAYSDETVGQPRKHGRGHLQYPRPEARPATEWLTLTVPAIVTPDLWEQAQERLALNARDAVRNTQHPYLLRGLLVCGVCGRTLQGRTQGTTVTYHCTHGGKHRPPGVVRHTRTVRASEVESRVWQTLRELLQAPEQIREAWQALQDDGNSPPEQALHDRQCALKQHVHRLVVAYQEGGITLTELKTQRAPLDAEIQRLTEQLGRAQQQTARLPDLATFTKLIERALEAADFEIQQKVIRLLIDHIVVADDAITVTHIVPTIDSRLDHTCRDS